MRRRRIAGWRRISARAPCVSRRATRPSSARCGPGITRATFSDIPFDMFERKVAVIGGGAWGLALASSAARAENDVVLLSRRALDGNLPKNVRHVKSAKEAA